jgi:hypothetical protein
LADLPGSDRAHGGGACTVSELSAKAVVGLCDQYWIKYVFRLGTDWNPSLRIKQRRPRQRGLQLCLPACLSVCLSTCLSVCLSACLSTSRGQTSCARVYTCSRHTITTPIMNMLTYMSVTAYTTRHSITLHMMYGWDLNQTIRAYVCACFLGQSPKYRCVSLPDIGGGRLVTVLRHVS